MLNNLEIESRNSLEKASKFLKAGKLVAVKTETVYGVACDPLNVKALERLYNLKRRPKYNPLIIHVNSIKLAEKIAYITTDAEVLMKKFWPGPLTLVLPLKKNQLVHDFAISGLSSIAVRQPSSTLMCDLIKKLNAPIAAPSANESGYISATDATHVIDSFGDKIDFVINSGRTKYGLESTIIDMTVKPYVIRRLGVIDHITIKKKTGIEIKLLSKKVNNSSTPNSPGQLIKHYSPRTPLTINIKTPDINDAFLNFGRNNLSHSPSLNLSQSSNLDEAAYNLFDFLRKLDKLKKKRISVAPIPSRGIGRTINERLSRARN